MKGLDKYSGSSREVRAETDGPWVILAVEATSGSNEGEALLTPEQARSIAHRLTTVAKLAEDNSGWMEAS